MGVTLAEPDEPEGRRWPSRTSRTSRLIRAGRAGWSEPDEPDEQDEREQDGDRLPQRRVVQIYSGLVGVDLRLFLLLGRCRCSIPVYPETKGFQ